jgi:glycosyltransferase involved in cell wall biosynthesis
MTGGPPRVVTRLAAAQAKLGHGVTILAHDAPSAGSAFRDMVCPLPGFESVKVELLPSCTRVQKLWPARSSKAAESLLGRHDVLHIHNVWDSILRASCRAAMRGGVPYFIQPNGMLDPWSLDQKKHKKRVAIALYYRQMINHAAGIFAGNDQERRLIEPLRFKPPVTIVPLNGIFPEEVEPQPQAGAFFERYPALGGKPFVLFLGRFHHKKGIDYLADAFARFAKRNADAQLVMVGVDDGAEEDFRRRVRQNSLERRVHMVGPLHGVAKWEAMRDATCFTLPSRQEGFSIAITEALACGVPVVITPGCHFDEVADAEAGFVVEPTDEAICGAFEKLFVDAELRGRASHAARELVRTRFSSYVMAERVIEAYVRAIDRSRPAQVDEVRVRTDEALV